MAFNIYDELAKEKQATSQAGMNYANLPSGSVATAVMGQMGGMFGKSMANLAGAKTDAQKKQGILEGIRDKFPNPTTRQDFMGMANELRNAGMYDLAEDAMKQGKELATTDAYVKQVEAQAAATEDKKLARRNKPKLRIAFKYQVLPTKIRDWLQALAPEADVSKINSESQASTFIASVIKDKGEIKRQNKLFKEAMKFEEESYIANRLYDKDVKDVSKDFTEESQSVWDTSDKPDLGSTPNTPTPDTSSVTFNEPILEGAGTFLNELGKNIPTPGNFGGLLK